MQPPLHIVFTMDCEPPTRKHSPNRPGTWEISARAIEGFCDRVLARGYATTLFVSPRVAEEQEPLLNDLASRGVELALHVHPEQLDIPGYTRYLGAYDEQDQHDLIEHATERFSDALGVRPLSFRGGDFSANDATFGVLVRLGFRQGSLSSPGRQVARQAAHWRGADSDPHYADLADRLRRGSSGFLEVPVTSDALQPGSGGFSPDVCIELGSFTAWHQPLIEGQLQRMASEEQPFRTVCVFTHNRFAYHLDDDKHAQTLAALLDYFDSLHGTYAVVPTTLSDLHARFRALAERPGFMGRDPVSSAYR